MDLNTIYNENCLETLQRMPDEFLDCVVTSPPYDDLREYGGYSFDFEPIAGELFRVMKTGGVMIWVVGDATKDGNESGTSFRQALHFQSLGFRLHDTMIYEKVNYAPLTHNRYEQAFEYIFALAKGRPNTFNPIRINCQNAGKLEKYALDRRQSHGAKHAMRLYSETTFIATAETKIAGNIFSYTIGDEKTGHPAPFPSALVADQLHTWSNPDDIIYDPFLGSGTTALVAHKLGRQWIGSELNPEYVEIAKKRLQPYLDQVSLF